MRYVNSKIEQDQIDLTYRIYMSEALKAITQNTLNFSGNGIMLNKSFMEMLKPEKEETRSADEIISHMKDKLGKFNGRF